MKDELIKVIAEYLGSVMTYNNSLTRIRFERACVNGAAEFIKQEAAEITGKLLPIVGEKDFPYTELFDHMAEQHGLTLTNTELGDIIHIARGGKQKTGWEGAPSWAMWLASNNKGLSQWFEDKPIWDDDIQMWDASTEDGRYKFAGKLAKVKELQQRPK
jgi:hypothetical protein